MRVLTFFILYFLISVGSLEAQVTSSTLVGLNIGNIAPELDFKNVNDKNIKLSSSPNYKVPHLNWEYLIYKDEETLTARINMVKYKDMADIAKAGLELAKKHTYNERVKSLLEKLDVGN